MEILFVTGVSGAGKSRVMDVLEDLDFYCVDNMPPKLIPTFLELINNTNDDYKKVAIATDIRGGDFFNDFGSTLNQLLDKNIYYRIIFMDCSDDELLKRYKLSRRRHPLMEENDKNIKDAISREKSALSNIRGRADFVIDTTFLKPSGLKERILNILKADNLEGMMIYCMSFGFKYGSPSEADLMFDVRCMPNPFYVEELKNKTGLQKEVSDYVMNYEGSKQLLLKFEDLIDFLIPLYEAEGKSQLVIAYGCSGGRHRSVTFAEKTAQHLREKGFKPVVSHRDIEK